MTESMRRKVLYFFLVVLYLLHNDLWLWNNPRLVAGIPVGLLYHIGFCVAVTLLMYGLVHQAWPRHLATERGGDDPVARKENT